ncbi:MAG: RHS repeat-associated core domain-containing protein [Saprospiraceae bacterium]
MKEFTYDASGTKLRKQVLNSLSQQILKQDYVSGIEYRNDTIEAIYHSDGRTVWNGSAWRYEYNVADHLGNVRAVISDLDGDKILDFTGVATTNEIINVNSYYAFGMVMQNGNFANNTTTPDTKYQYNNKEFNGDLGLNLLDYGARWYDQAVGRFTGLDPLADLMCRHSPYNYAFNNPLRFIDPDGMAPTDVIISGDKKQEAFNALQASTSLTLTMDEKTGKVSATGEAKTKSDKELQAAVNDKDKTVNLNATSANEVTMDGEVYNLPVGGYGGSKKEGDRIVGNQTVNTDQAAVIEGNGGPKASQIVLHEVLESYKAMNIGTGVHVYDSDDGRSTYTKAHNATNKLPAANTSGLEGNVRRDDKANPGVSTYYYKNPKTGKEVEIFRVSL